MRVVYHVATSIDGFIADQAGGVEWLEKVQIDQQSTGLEAFFNTVDGLLMGRRTYDFLVEYGAWPYGTKPAWVCTTQTALPRLEGCELQAETDPVRAVAKAREMGLQKLWMVGGGVLARKLLVEKQLTQLVISLMPVVLGGGVRVIDIMPEPVFFRQSNVIQRDGFTEIEYDIEWK